MEIVATLTNVRLVWMARARYATATRTRNAVMIKTRLTAAIRIKPAVKEVVVTLLASSAVMARAVTRQTAKSAKMALVSGPFRRICVKLMLKTWGMAYFGLNTDGILPRET
jgi:hypothetical protein